MRVGRHFAVNGSVGFIDDGAASKLLRDEAVRRGFIIDMEQSDIGFTFIFTRSLVAMADVHYEKSELMAVLKACYQAWKEEEA